MTQAETLVALQAAMFAGTGQLYWDLNHYPFLVSPYMPLFFAASAGLDWLGAPPLAAGRWLSAASVLLIVWLSWKLLSLCTANFYARWIGTALVAVTANLWVWGTVGQVDVAGVMFSLAALYQYTRYENGGNAAALRWAGVFVVLALFCKQTLIAAPVAIALTLALSHFRRAVWFSVAVGGFLLGAVVAMNLYTEGRFFDNAVRANLNPFSTKKMSSQLEYFTLVAGSLVLIAAAGAGHAWRKRDLLLYLYLAAALGVFLLTAGKIGSDLNYQVEPLLALALCSAWTLDRLDFFPRLFRADRGAATLLQIPLMLYVVVNLGVTLKTLAERIMLEPVRREEYQALRPYLENVPGNVISLELDPLLHAHGRLDVEGELFAAPRYVVLSDPEPVRRDLLDGKIPVVILFEDIFGGKRWTDIIEDMPTLPEAHLDAIRKNYRLVARVPGALLDGVYVYRPVTVKP
jgi:hypothetical protein